MITYGLAVSIERKNAKGETLLKIGPRPALITNEGLEMIASIPSHQLICGCVCGMSTDSISPTPLTAVGTHSEGTISYNSSFSFFKDSDVGKYFIHENGVCKITEVTNEYTIQVEGALDTLSEVNYAVVCGPTDGRLVAPLYSTLAVNNTRNKGALYSASEGKTKINSVQNFKIDIFEPTLLNEFGFGPSLKGDLFGHLPLTENLELESSDILFIKTELIRRVGDSETVDDEDGDNWKRSPIGRIIPMLELSEKAYSIQVNCFGKDKESVREYIATSSYVPGSHTRVWGFNSELLDSSVTITSVNYKALQEGEYDETYSREGETTFECSVNWKRANCSMSVFVSKNIEIVDKGVRLYIPPCNHLSTNKAYGQEWTMSLDGQKFYVFDYEDVYQYGLDHTLYESDMATESITYYEDGSSRECMIWGDNGKQLYFVDYFGHKSNFALFQYSTSTPYNTDDLTLHSVVSLKKPSSLSTYIDAMCIHPSGKFFVFLDDSYTLWVCGMREPFNINSLYYIEAHVETGQKYSITGLCFDQTGEYLFLNVYIYGIGILLYKPFSITGDVASIGSAYGFVEVVDSEGKVSRTGIRMVGYGSRFFIIENNSKIAFGGTSSDVTIFETNLGELKNPTSKVFPTSTPTSFVPVLEGTFKDTDWSGCSHMSVNDSETALLAHDSWWDGEMSAYYLYEMSTPGDISTLSLVKSLRFFDFTHPGFNAIRVYNNAMYGITNDTIYKMHIDSSWDPDTIVEITRVEILSKFQNICDEYIKLASFYITDEGSTLVCMVKADMSDDRFSYWEAFYRIPMATPYDLTTLGEVGSEEIFGIDVSGNQMDHIHCVTPTHIWLGSSSYCTPHRFVFNEDGTVGNMEGGLCFPQPNMDVDSLYAYCYSIYEHPLSGRVYVYMEDDDYAWFQSYTNGVI